MAAANEAVDLLYVLPEDCISSVISFTSPRDACRSSSVSTSFKSVAESDAVWGRFLPPQYQNIISRSADSSSLCFSSKKELYLRLCDHPLLIDDGRKSFWLEKRSGKICYMLSPKDLTIASMDTPKYWRWTSLPEARFPEVAKLLRVFRLEIRGKINSCMLSPATLYTAWLVFDVATGSFGFEFQPIEVVVGVAGSENHKRSVYLDVKRGWRPHFGIGPIQLPGVGLFKRSRIMYQAPRPREKEDAYGECPKKRGDGWLEIELGEFFNGREDDREVEMSILEVNGNWKGGLIVQGIEIRPKE